MYLELYSVYSHNTIYMYMYIYSVHIPGAGSLRSTAQVKCDGGVAALERLLVEDACSGLLILLLTLLKTLHV